MKKILLSLLALVAMVGMANAQRAWAYDLGLGFESDTYTFTFKATTAANATLIFTDAEGNELATHDAGAVVAGANSVALTKAQLPEGTEIHWAVKLSGDAIAEMAEVTDQSRGIYDFYNMMDVLVDNDPESADFGKIYIQMAYDGASDAATDRSAAQKAGLFIYDQALNELNNPSNESIKPTLPVGYTMGDNRNKFHRLAIDPKTGNLTYCYNVAGSPAVFAIDRANPTGLVTNIIVDIEGLTQTAAHCYDAEGALYVMDLPGAGTIYKIVDGVATVFAASDSKWVNASMTLESDGMGGLWVAQNRGQMDGYYQLAHVNKDGAIDWTVYNSSAKDGFAGSSNRGAMAYDAIHQVLAQGRNGVVELYSVEYDATTGVPTLTKIATTSAIGTNIDGLHFDYAGDLYVVNSSKEKFQKFVLPTTNNVCTTPAPKAQVIINSSEVVTYTISAAANDPAMGSVTGGGVFIQDEEVTLTATPAEGHKFVSWSNGETANPYVFTATENLELTANFEVLTYTLTVNADAARGTVSGAGTYAYGTEVVLTATANDGYEFTGWSNGKTDNPLTITISEDTELTANFRVILASSLTLNALPVQDYSASIQGTIKRAVQLGENTIVLSHVDATPHIYNIDHATQTVTEISQEGVVAAESGYLSISDIAVTEDDKLVACNYVLCTYTPSNTSYFYIWNDLAGAPAKWFTSQKSGNFNNAYVGHTMAVKGTSTEAQVITSAVTTASTTATRYNVYSVINSEVSYKYVKGLESMYYSAVGDTYELNASPIAEGNWIVDGELISPIELVAGNNSSNVTTNGTLDADVLGKKYNGASYLKNYNEHHLMVAPYANADGYLAGVKVLDIVDGFDAAVELTTNTDLATAINAKAAAATASIDNEGKLTIHLFADAQVYTFTEAIEYTDMDLNITNTVFDAETMAFIGSDDEYGIEVSLVPDMEKVIEGAEMTFGLAATSTMTFAGQDLEILDGQITIVDIEAPAANAIVAAKFGEEYYRFNITMTKEAAAIVEVAIEGATVAVEEATGVLSYASTWTYEEVTYPVSVRLAGYEEGKTEYAAAQVAELQIGGDGDDDLWLDWAVANEADVALEGVTITLEAYFTSYSTGTTYHVIISGDLPQGPATGVDNINAAVEAQKIIRNGQVLIIRDGKTLNMMGQQVK